jgi:hypothetical protein
MIFESQFVPLRIETQLVICGFLLAFSLGFCLGPLPLSGVFQVRAWMPRNLYYAASAGLAAVSLGLAGSVLVASGGFAALRASLGSGADAPSTGIAVSFPMTSTAWLLARLTGDRKVAILFACLTFTLAVATTSKVFILIGLVQLLQLERNWSVRDMIRVGLAVGVVGLAAFVILHLALGKVVQGDASLAVLLSRTLLTYVLSGIAGLNVLFQQDAVFPGNSMWITVARSLPWTVDVPDSAILPWVRLGDWNGNVYTAFAYWLDGWGTAGFTAWAAVLGIMVRTLRNRTDIASQTCFRLLVFSVFMAFHQDFLLPSIYLWVAFAVAAAIAMQVRLGSDSGEPFTSTEI